MSIAKKLAAFVIPAFMVANGIAAEKKIALIAGHDYRASSGGASGIAGKESEINLKIALRLEDYLESQKFAEVFVNRRKLKYDPGLISYIQNKSDKKTGGKNISYYRILTETANYLNENKLDIIVNIHMNDVNEKFKNRRNFEGFCIYYSTDNADAKHSKLLAECISSSLKKHKFKISNNSKELGGVLRCSDWVLVGNHRIKLMEPSILIEYGYVYEKKFRKSETHDYVAYCTNEGIKEYYKKVDEETPKSVITKPIAFIKSLY